MNDEEFKKDQEEAFKSLDKDVVLAYFRKYEIPVALIASSDLVMWAGIHKARLCMPYMTEEEKELSRKWLIENNFEPGVMGRKL